MDTKYCTSCSRDLPVDDFNLNRSTDDGYQYYCRECQSEWKAQHRGAKPEFRRHRRVRTLDFTKLVRETPCVRCGSTRDVGAYHDLPICRGGQHIPANIVALGRPCGAKKQNLTMNEWPLDRLPRRYRRRKVSRIAVFRGPVTSKLCPGCKVEKDVCEFNRRNKGPNGLDHRCRECRKEERRLAREKVTTPAKRERLPVLALGRALRNKAL